MATRMERMTEPKGAATTAPAILMNLASPFLRFMALGRSSVRRVSMQVTMTIFLSGKRSVRKDS